MSGESKQQKNQETYKNQESTPKDQKQNKGYGDKKLNGPDQPST
ncbi:hypothetical protein [Fictibacillus barbaricus]|uniref:3-methyladenine DNA glycosylase n=1 Tax=Fictibacillus barbaricus TaxID=182136 RepID=A0ABU1TZ61_9BACL|nr:hypothetical protein [Fictibacillus barbaricus]MDR7072499.1 hypothetical protein [Fictibacillus barbaricus]